MERLTVKTEKGTALKMGDTYLNEDAARKDLTKRYRIAIDRLADYEDTGRCYNRAAQHPADPGGAAENGRGAGVE